LNYLVKMPALKEIDFHWSNWESTKFASALCRLRDRAKYHHSRLVQCINDPVFEQLARDWVERKIDTPEHFMERSSQLNDIIDPELAAMLQALRSQFDIYGQIINAEILSPSKDIRSFSIAFKKISNHLQPNDLQEKINEILAHENFIYIDEFVNLSKHVVTPGVNSWGVNGDEKRMMEGQKISENNLNIIPEKDLVWAVEFLKPWVDHQVIELTKALKQCQIKKLNDSGVEWNSEDF
jgi:hypothetical protein